MQQSENNNADFYKHDKYPDEIWLNKEYLVQLNLTGNCPMSCDFCYIKKTYSNVYLSLKNIKNLWRNLRIYNNIGENINIDRSVLLNLIENLGRLEQEISSIKE